MSFLHENWYIIFCVALYLYDLHHSEIPLII